MKPISRLRTRACSAGGRPATSAPLRKYFPSVDEFSSPITDSSVDLPQPDGPLMETYSPCVDGEMNVVERPGLDFVGVEDLLDALQVDEVRGVHGFLRRFYS